MPPSEWSIDYDGLQIIGAGAYAWLIDIATGLRKALGEAGTKAPTVEVADDVVQTAAATNPAMQTAAPRLGVQPSLDNPVAKALFGLVARPTAVTFADCGRILRNLPTIDKIEFKKIGDL